jgi:hypothetical protein
VTVLRPPRWQRLLNAIALASPAILLLVGGLDEGGWVLPVAAVGALAVLAGAWRSHSMRVELGPEVRVVNFFRTHVVPWAEVDRFSYESGAVLRRTDSRWTAIRIFTPPPGALPFVERNCRRAVAEMERVRRRRSR